MPISALFDDAPPGVRPLAGYFAGDVPTAIEFCSDEEAGTELYLLSGRALLQASDGLWYFVGLGTEDEYTALRIEQSPTAHPGGSIRTDIIFDVAGTGYRFHLVNDNGAIVRGNPTASAEAGVASLALRSTNGSDYNLSMAAESGVVTHKVSQTANA